MRATASYDARPFRDALYERCPEQATLDALDPVDRAIARRAFDLAHERAPQWPWTQIKPWLRYSMYALAVLERHPNPARAS